MLSVGSLFSGIGGFDLGFERAGMRVAWHAEVEPFASAVLAKHWPGVPNHGDVRSIRAGAVEPVDVLCGGFPCQDISVAGKGAGIEGEHSGLWREYARLVRELRPRWVVAENVPALRTRGYHRVADDLEAAGYAVWPFVVGADDIGAPHRRKRVWIVAYANRELVGQSGRRHGEGGADAVLAGIAGRAGAAPDADPQRRELERRGGLLDGERPAQRDDAVRCAGARVSADADSTGLEGWIGERLPQRSDELAARARSPSAFAGWRWDEAPEPTIRRLDDGIPAGLVRHRRPALAALGNALVPQIAEAIGRAIMSVERAQRQPWQREMFG